MKSQNNKLLAEARLGFASGSALITSSMLSLNIAPAFSSLKTFATSEPIACSLKCKEWLNSEEAAEYLGIPVASLRNMTSNGHLPFYKVPGTRCNRYLRAELHELLLSSRKGVAYGI